MGPQDLKKREPMDAGGISAFCKSEYKEHLKTSGYYECVHLWTCVDPFAFAHPTIPPSQGSLLGMFSVSFDGKIRLHYLAYQVVSFVVICCHSPG